MDKNIKNYTQIEGNMDLMATHNEIYEAYQNYGRPVHEKGRRWRKNQMANQSCFING
jgi:hypothetical protein